MSSRTITPSVVEFRSGASTCRALHYAAATARRRPCVVMAHGFGGTRDAGLEPYAEHFADAGLDVLLFDYRHFGESDGEPRQLLSIRRQLGDWRAAVRCARGLSGVDEHRIALWGTSFSGGHVIRIASEDEHVAAVVAQAPMLDGAVALGQVRREAGFRHMARLTAAGIVDLVRAAAGRSRHTIAIAGAPGSRAALTTSDALPGCEAIFPPGWRNEVAAGVALSLPFYRPLRRLERVRCPVLIQVAQRDRIVPPEVARRAAERPPVAEFHEYPIGHFDVYGGKAFRRAVDDQVDFLARHLHVSTASPVAADPAPERLRRRRRDRARN
ncbi:MAG TPA: alpha/beta hydrolase [Solirubrobacteraceae bacterium]|jgi:pimeloyl-ACP methyl ester carboxylesterase